MTSLSHIDQRHFEAAQGWLELGDWRSAIEELECIEPQNQAKPDVLKLRVEIFSAAKEWKLVAELAASLAQLLPDDVFGHVRLAFAHHEMKRTREAFDGLSLVALKFPSEWVIPYNLACYSAQLGDLVGARDWLAQAFRLGNARQIKLQAENDPDLAPLFENEASE